ncbi:MAG: hypothetical protein WAU52_05585 [Burkholderiales bacterium]
MTGYAFGLTTPRDFLAKARREVERLAEAESQAYLAADVALLQDTAINAALSLWHVSDWIARSPEQPYVDAIERIRVERPSQKKAPLEILREQIRDSSHMALCEALANGAKHLTLRQPPRLDPTRLQNTGGPYTGTSAVDIAANVTLQPGVSTALSRYYAKLQINDTGMPALEAFKAALAYWDSFFANYGL